MSPEALPLRGKACAKYFRDYTPARENAPRTIIKDYTANKRDMNGDADNRFEDFLKENKIKHIKARVKHPQTNGKLEKWNDTYELNRSRFENFDKFVNWYNTVRFHEALDTKWYLQTPDNAFWSRLPEGCKLGMFLNRMETELND